MAEMIQQKRQEGRDHKVERYDLFSSLVDASEDEENGAGLTDLELMGLFKSSSSATPRSRDHQLTSSYFFWLDTKPLPIRFAIHLDCSLYIRMNKRSCTSTARAYRLMGRFQCV